MVQRSAQQLDSLVRLAAFVASNLQLYHNPALTAKTLADLRDHITAAEGALAGVFNSLSGLRTNAESIDKAVDALVSSVAQLDFAHVTLRGTTAMTYQARANAYLSMDAGLMGARHIRSVIPYFGVNLYRIPVNKNMPLAHCGCWGQRVALTLGVTAASIKQESRIDDLFNSHAVILGAGLRVTDYWRVTMGSLFVKKYPDGPNNGAKIGALIGGATSIDIDVVNALGKVGSSLIPNLK
jgi:hypothetical protein